MDQEIFQYWAAVDKHHNKVVNLFETENQGKDWFKYYRGRYRLELAPVVVAPAVSAAAGCVVVAPAAAVAGCAVIAVA